MNPKLQESDEGQKSTQEAYQKYIQKRDLGEFFLRNPYSPLLSVDPKVFLPTWFFLSKANPTIEAAATQVEELTTLIDQQQLMQVADYARSIADWDDFQKSETYNVGNWPLYYSAERVDWKVAQLKPSLVGLYHIKRKYHCTWKQAQQLLQFRINRHGQTKVDSASNMLRANLQSKERPYRGDPLPGRGALEPPQDGLAAFLGKHEIWLDMFDLGRQRMKNKDY
ncbi:MAG: hypothetical protein R2828_00810 [Saprospiraceae bacterium]